MTYRHGAWNVSARVFHPCSCDKTNAMGRQGMLRNPSSETFDHLDRIDVLHALGGAFASLLLLTKPSLLANRAG
jgi:hypothetical protein